MNQISIQLNQSEYCGGEEVKGEVVVSLVQDTPIRGIRLLLQGYEKSIWREGSGKRRHTHSEKRDWFDEEITLHGRSRLSFGELVADSFKGAFSNENYEVMQAGIYRYPFSYVLPPGLPGDYESALTNSRIYYGAKALVDLPLKFDLETVAPLVIHDSPELTPTHAVSERLTKSFLLDSDSLVEATIRLDKDAFHPGEVLRCKLEVVNRAPNKEIDAATVVLRQIEKLRAGGHTCERQAEIGRAKVEGCRFPYKNRTEVDLEYEIPGDLYPTISRASLVKLEYEVQVVLHIPWAVDAKLSAPIRLVPKPR